MGSASVPARRLLAAAGLVAVLCAGAAAVPAPAAAACTPGSGWGTLRPSAAAEVVRLVNQHRSGLGLRPLATSQTLTAAADYKSLNMAAGGPFDHNDVVQRVQACGYPAQAAIGENIAAGQRTAQEVMAGWLRSPGHRANIEYPGFAAIGVGVADSARGRFWTQDFGSVVDSGSAPPAPAPPPPAPRPPAPAPPPPAPLVSPISAPPLAHARRARCRVGGPRTGCRPPRCRLRGQRVRCRVAVADASVARVRRVRLRRHGMTWAARRRGVPVRDGVARLRLHIRRPVHRGRYTLALTVRDASGDRRRERLRVRVRPRR